MPDPITLRVAGEPAPQGSKSAFVVWPKGGKPKAVITDGKKGSPGRVKLDAWRGDVAATAARWRLAHQTPPPLTGPVRVRIAFHLPKPPSTPRWRWLAWQKPDLDKLTRSTLDALTDAKILTDDGQVVELLVRKVYAVADHPTGAVIRLESLAEREVTEGKAWAAAGGSPPRL